MFTGASAAIPTVKALTGWSPAAVGIWSLLVIQLFVLAVAVVRFGPNWIKAWADRDKERVATEREDQAGFAARINALEERVNKSETVSMYLTGATTLLLNALRAVDPNNAAIEQANNLVEMAVAAGGETVWSKSLAKLATVRGVNE